MALLLRLQRMSPNRPSQSPLHRGRLFDPGAAEDPGGHLDGKSANHARQVPRGSSRYGQSADSLTSRSSSSISGPYFTARRASLKDPARLQVSHRSRTSTGEVYEAAGSHTPVYGMSWDRTIRIGRPSYVPSSWPPASNFLLAAASIFVRFAWNMPIAAGTSCGCVRSSCQRTSSVTKTRTGSIGRVVRHPKATGSSAIIWQADPACPCKRHSLPLPGCEGTQRTNREN